MGDLACDWGGDLGASPSGDFAVASGELLSRQRVVRRLLNNRRLVLDDGEILSADYLYDPEFGESLGRRIGSDVGPQSLAEVVAFVREGLQGEDTVDQTQPPTVLLTRVEGGLRLKISYIYAATGAPITLPSLVFA